MIKKWMLNNGFTNLMIVAGIALGSIIGHISPEKGSMIGNYVDYLVFLLVMLLFFEMKVLISKNIVEQVRFLSIVWITNFLIVPLIGYFISMFFFGDKPAIYIGLIIYFMAPCTNWFLGFTKIAGGGVTHHWGLLFLFFDWMCFCLVLKPATPYADKKFIFGKWQPRTY